MSEKEVFEEYYRNVTSREQLAWHHQEPNEQLKAAIESRSKPGSALDMGCGSGNDSVYMAKQGWNVTSVDFMPQALAMTAEYAEENGVSVHTVEADVVEWDNDEQFDLVLDSGLMHNMDRSKLLKYKSRILDRLKPDGDFVLAHWESRDDQDRLNGGPRRVNKDQIVALLGPELGELKGFNRNEFRLCQDCDGFKCEQKNPNCSGVGPHMSVAFFWFRRS